MRGNHCIESCFVYANTYCIFHVAVMLFLTTLPAPPEEDEPDVCPLRRFLKDSGHTADLYYEIELKSDIDSAKIVFFLCGLILYPLGIVGSLTRIKGHLRVHLVGVGVLTLAYLAFLMTESVDSNIEYDKGLFTQCIALHSHNFMENATDSSLAQYFREYKCCSPDGNIVQFWNRTKWHPDPNRPAKNLADIPKQCCRDSSSFECLDTGAGHQDRLNIGCWEQVNDVFGDALQLRSQVFVVVPYTLITILNVYLIVSAVYLYKRFSKPLPEPAVRHTQTTTEFQDPD